MTAPHTILLVDDDDDVREAAAEILYATGYRVLVAANGGEALRFLGQERVDVLFTDIVMPEINGMAKQAKRLRPGLKILFMTGCHSRAREAKELGKLVFKPFRELEIMAKLAEVLAAD